MRNTLLILFFLFTTNSIIGQLVTGEYDTQWGILKLSQSGNAVSGTYPHSEGRIQATLEGNVLTGRWTQTSTKGNLRFVFSEDFGSFTGTWSSSYDVPPVANSAWNGERIGFNPNTIDRNSFDPFSEDAFSGDKGCNYEDEIRNNLYTLRKDFKKLQDFRQAFEEFENMEINFCADKNMMATLFISTPESKFHDSYNQITEFIAWVIDRGGNTIESIPSDFLKAMANYFRSGDKMQGTYDEVYQEYIKILNTRHATLKNLNYVIEKYACHISTKSFIGLAELYHSDIPNNMRCTNLQKQDYRDKIKNNLPVDFYFLLRPDEYKRWKRNCEGK